jgi:hypothetical protein
MSSKGNRSNPNQTRTSGHPSPASEPGGSPADRDGTHSESRQHNKHNDPGQDGHKKQRHNPAEEKH